MTGCNSLKAHGVLVMGVVLGVMLAGTCAAQVEDADLDKHLIAKWDFEGEGDIAADRSGNGHDGTLTAYADAKFGAKRVEGMVGKARQFSKLGGTAVRVKDSQRLNPTQGLTIAAWIKKDYYVEGKWTEETGEIIGKKAHNGKYGYRLYVTGSGKLRFEVGEGKNEYSLFTTEKRTIHPDRWYHVAATFSPGRMRLYINTHLKRERDVEAQRIAASGNDLIIGNYGGSRRNAGPFNGLIDEVCIFDVALEADDILKLAQPEQAPE